MRKNAPMIRRLLAAAALVTLALMGTVAVLVALNAPPAVPALTATTIAGSPKPYVVKLHAQWCPYCMFTKDEWTQIEQRYGSRVHLLVLDFTSEAATARSRAEAERLNLGQFFDEYAGATGGDLWQPSIRGLSLGHRRRAGEGPDRSIGTGTTRTSVLHRSSARLRWRT
jgi:thiol-disulfide isomerase/thioredoxin